MITFLVDNISILWVSWIQSWIIVSLIWLSSIIFIVFDSWSELIENGARFRWTWKMAGDAR